MIYEINGAKVVIHRSDEKTIESLLEGVIRITQSMDVKENKGDKNGKKSKVIKQK